MISEGKKKVRETFIISSDKYNNLIQKAFYKLVKPKPQKRRQDLELENSFVVLQEADYSDNEESSAEETESSLQEKSTLSYSISEGNESRED